MKALLDSGVWWKWVTRDAMRPALVSFLENQVTEMYVCPVSVMEIFYHIQRGRLDAPPNDPEWKTNVLRGFRIAPVNFEAAKLAGSWNWEHGDPCDRLIAAVAETEGITLVHTDTKLEKLTGFPQMYFRNVSKQLPGSASA